MTHVTNRYLPMMSQGVTIRYQAHTLSHTHGSYQTQIMSCPAGTQETDNLSQFDPCSLTDMLLQAQNKVLDASGLRKVVDNGAKSDLKQGTQCTMARFPGNNPIRAV